MTKLFDHKVELIKDPKHSGLYDQNWCIIDNSRLNSIGYIPYIWTQNFSFDSFRLITNLDFEKDEEILSYIYPERRKKKPKIEKPSWSTDVIRAVLNPISDATHNTKYEILGKNGFFDNFELDIEINDKYLFEASYYPLDNKNYEIGFSLHIPEAEFQNLIHKIRNKSITKGHFSVKGVDGFYSMWSPEAKTDNIKILTNELVSNDEFFIRPDGCQISPPVLGQRVHSMGIHFSEVYKFDQSSTDW